MTDSLQNGGVQYVARTMRHDRRANRDKLGRWLVFLAIEGGFIALGIFFGVHFGATTLHIAMGVVGGLLLSSAFFPSVTLYEEPLKGIATLDTFTGSMVNYGAGLHPKYPWETVDRQSNERTLEILTMNHSETYDSRSGTMDVTYGFQYIIDLGRLDVHLGINEEDVDKSFAGILSSFLSDELSSMTAEEAREAVYYLGLKARHAFGVAPEDIPEEHKLQEYAKQFGNIADVRGRNGGQLQQLEREYGVKFLLVYIQDIDYPEEVQKARGAVSEQENLVRIAASLMGYNPEDLERPRKGPRIRKEMREHPNFSEVLASARVVAGNSTEHVLRVSGDAGSTIAGAFARMADGSLAAAPASTEAGNTASKETT